MSRRFEQVDEKGALISSSSSSSSSSTKQKRNRNEEEEDEDVDEITERMNFTQVNDIYKPKASSLVNSTDYITAKTLWADVSRESQFKGPSNEWIDNNQDFTYCPMHHCIQSAIGPQQDMPKEPAQEKGYDCEFCFKRDVIEAAYKQVPTVKTTLTLALSNEESMVQYIKENKEIYLQCFLTVQQMRKKNPTNLKLFKYAYTNLIAFSNYEKACWDISCHLRKVAGTDAKVGNAVVREFGSLVNEAVQRFGKYELKTYCHVHKQVGSSLMTHPPRRYYTCGICLDPSKESASKQRARKEKEQASVTKYTNILSGKRGTSMAAEDDDY